MTAALDCLVQLLRGLRTLSVSSGLSIEAERTACMHVYSKMIQKLFMAGPSRIFLFPNFDFATPPVQLNK
jgi:hypothetical protein